MMQYPNYLNPLAPKKSSFLRYQPPGFSYPIDIPFPGRVLPVCARCKKNYKTREHCRSKEGHTSLPWTDTYICITLDASCILPDGSLSEGPFVATGLNAQPFVYESSKVLDPKTPSCAMCKDKNYTRTYCRASKKHKTLPWSTVYVVLTARDGHPSSGSTAHGQESSKKKRKIEDGEKVGKDDTYLGLVGGESGEKKEKEGEKKSEEKGKEDASEDKDKKAEDGNTEGAKTTEGKTDEKKEKEAVKDEGEDDEKQEKTDIFQKIHQSRTFLSTVSINKNEAEWVELDSNQAQYLSHRQKQDGTSADASAADAAFPTANPYGMMTGNLGAMGMNMAGFPGNYGHAFPGAMGATGGGTKDDPNRPNGMDRSPMDNQWMNGTHGMPSHPMPYSDMMSQMVDPRMAYGFHHPGWHGRGYPTPMDMAQMHNPYGAQNPYNQYPPMGQYPMDMGQGMPPQAMAQGMTPQGMQQQANFSPQSFAQQGMVQGNMTPGQGQPSQKDGIPHPNNTPADSNGTKASGAEDDKKGNGKKSDDKKSSNKSSPQKDEEADI